MSELVPPARGDGGPLLPPDLGVLASVWTALSRTSLPVLVTGETGTGKSHLVRRLHEVLAPGAPLVEVNVAALTPALFASEMFGHQRGAFTGAAGPKPGLAWMARGGVLFFDEIAELLPECQAQLLSFIDTGAFRPVGSVREMKIRVRFFAATNQDLAALVRAGRFRQDLYWRLASVVVSLPPLRERPGDIVALAGMFLAGAAERHDLPPATLSADAMELLLEHPWPGNVRQLRTVLEQVAAVWPGEQVTARQLSRLLGSRACVHRPASSSPPEVRPLAQMERELVLRALETAGGNQTRAARLLGISPRGLYNKLRRYGVT